jgi:uncharacterized protein (UPF0333 family)
MENIHKRGIDMFKFAFVLIVIILAANIYYFVKNFKEEKKAVADKMQENSNASNTKTYTAKNTTTNNTSANKTKSFAK